MQGWLLFFKSHVREHTGLTQRPVQVRSTARRMASGKVVTVKPHASSRWRRSPHELHQERHWELQGLAANAPNLVYRNDVIRAIAEQPAHVQALLHRVVHEDPALTNTHLSAAYRHVAHVSHAGAQQYLHTKIRQHPQCPAHVRVAMSVKGEGDRITPELQTKVDGVVAFLRQVATRRQTAHEGPRA